MFNNIPVTYDFMNRLLTLRFDELWRRKAVKECLKYHPKNVIDICSGTGDLAIHLAIKARKDCSIMALDFSEKMLAVAQGKALKKNLQDKITFIHGDVSNMPFPDNSFNSVGIAFGFRNLTFRNPISDQAMKEVYRILKPGGKFVIIESSQPSNKILKSFFRLYLNLAVKKLGGRLSGHRMAYHYLAFSAMNFPDAEEIKNMLLNNKFSKVKFEKLIGGIAALHVATK